MDYVKLMANTVFGGLAGGLSAGISSSSMAATFSKQVFANILLSFGENVIISKSLHEEITLYDCLVYSITGAIIGILPSKTFLEVLVSSLIADIAEFILNFFG